MNAFRYMSLKVAALGSGLEGPEPAIWLPLAEPGTRLEVTRIHETDIARLISFVLDDTRI